MRLGNYELAPITDLPTPPEAPKAFFSSQTKADSSYYSKYQLRPYNPDDLYQKKGDYSIFDEMRGDEQINALLTLKKFFILNGKREIECEDQEIKDFLFMCLDFYLDEAFDKKLYNILSAIEYGFSLTEKVFALKETEFGQKIVLADLITRPPHTFEFDQDDQGKVTQIRQHQGRGNDIVLAPTKFIHYAFQKEFDNPYGKSEFNSGVYRAWWSKNFLIKMWNIYNERYGMPTVVATYPASLSQHKSDLLQVLNNIQAKTSITIPEGLKLDTLSKSTSSGSEYEKAIDKYNTFISRSMLVPDLMGMSGGETGGGSYALGAKQFQMFYNNIEQERRNLERIINREIIYPLVLWNFGSSKWAEIKFLQVDEEQKQKDIALWMEGVKTGKIPVTNAHINWFLKQVNAPEIDPDELGAMEEAKAAIAEKIRGDAPEDQKEENALADMEEDGAKDDKKEDDEAGAPPEKPEDGTAMKGEVEDDEEEKEKEYEYKEAFRDLTVYEKRVDFARMDKDEEVLTSEFVPKIGESIKLSITAMLDDLKNRKVLEKKRFDIVNKLTFRYGGKLDKLFKDLMKSSYFKGSENIELPKKYEIYAAESLDMQVLEDWINANAIYVSTVEQEAIINTIKGTLINGIKNGDSYKDVIKAMESALSAYDIKLDPIRIELIVKTNIAKAYNQARQDQYKKISGEIVAYQYTAIRDGRTSPLCTYLDKKIFKPQEASAYWPPNHFRCRSTMVPVFTVDEFDGQFSDVSSAVPDKTYNDFLTMAKK